MDVRLLRKRTAFEMFSDNAAPPGFGYLTNRNPLPKRIFWFLVLVIGLIYPTYNFQKQYRKYRSFPSSIKPVVENLSPEISFPKVTLCANGIHSMSRIKEKYPWLPQEVAEKIYGPPVNTDELNEAEMDSVLIQQMKDTQFDKFAYETRSQLAIVGCKYLKTWDCTGKDKNGSLLAKEENPWKEIHTQFGYCQTLNPSQNYPVLRSQYFSYGRQVELSLIAIHNDTDGVGGQYQHSSGLTLYYADAKITSLSKFNSITVAPHDVPIISFKQYHDRFLGIPYDECVDDNFLDYHEHYSFGHCRDECLAKMLMRECGCKPHSHLNITMYQMKNPDSSRMRNCTLYDQIFCISKPGFKSDIVSHFNQSRQFKEDDCTVKDNKCTKGCNYDRPEAGLIQYGRYKYAESVANQQTSSCTMEDDCTTKPYGLEHVIAAVLYLSELDEITLQETKDYKRTHFMSDIGGGAGLILGISMASILGVFDVAIAALCRTIKQCLFPDKTIASDESKGYLEMVKAIGGRNSYDHAMAISSLSYEEYKLLKYRK